MSSDSGTSDVSSQLSSPPTSQPPSPLLSKLSLEDISDEAKAEAAKLKAEANKAFTCAYFRHLCVPCCPGVWAVMTSFDRFVVVWYGCLCGVDLNSDLVSVGTLGCWVGRAACSARLQQGGGAVHTCYREEPRGPHAVVQSRVHEDQARGTWLWACRRWCVCILLFIDGYRALNVLRCISHCYPARSQVREGVLSVCPFGRAGFVQALTLAQLSQTSNMLPPNDEIQAGDRGLQEAPHARAAEPARSDADG